MGSAITYDCTRGTKSGEESFKKFANNSGIIGGERFRFNPFRQESFQAMAPLVGTLEPWKRVASSIILQAFAIYDGQTVVARANAYSNEEWQSPP
ncbi:hypothetical protein Tco_0371034 [Tanacetum coccineum]